MSEFGDIIEFCQDVFSPGRYGHGNIACFRNLQKRVDSAISLFGDKNAGDIVLLKALNTIIISMNLRMENRCRDMWI